jgi:hypothetical protein
MRRITISLPDDVATALEREARRRRVPVSQVAREAIEARLGWNEEGPRDIPFIGVAASQGPGDLSAYVDTEEAKLEFADWIRADAFNRDP